jgi:MFS family permease
VAIIISLFCFMGLDTNLWLMRGLMFLTGAGMAFTFIPTPAAAFATISPADTGKASALYNAQRQLGAALGIAVVGTVLSIVGPVIVNAHTPAQPNLVAYHAAFLTSAALALIAAGLALFIHDRDAAATMRRKGKAKNTEEIEGKASTAPEVIVIE